MKMPEQIGKSRRWVNGPWRWIKRHTSKIRRRLERLLLADAPKKDYFKGYVA